jgi:uncharacterized membrane protein YczE
VHQGASKHTGLSIGIVSVVVGAAVLLLWWPLRQRPGLGTVSNVFVVGLSLAATTRFVPQPHALAVRVPLLAAAIVLSGVATGLYITARFGPGPRDGLMTGLHARTGRSVRLVRTGIEVTVLAGGFALGGRSGSGRWRTHWRSGRWPSSSCGSSRWRNRHLCPVMRAKTTTLPE